MAQKIVTDKDLYPILPIYINATKHFYDAFGNTEREISARWIVQLCQINDGWKPFTCDEIGAFSKEYDNFRFNGLDRLDGEIVEIDGVYYVTHEFIATCFKSSPNFRPTIRVS